MILTDSEAKGGSSSETLMLASCQVLRILAWLPAQIRPPRVTGLGIKGLGAVCKMNHGHL